MANWRARGYVPDSDDEDEEEEETDQPVNTVLGHGNTTTPEHPVETFSAPTKQDSSLEGSLAEISELSDRNRSSQLRGVYDSFPNSYSSAQPGHHATEPLVSSPPLQNTGGATAAMLEAELQKGLQTVQDILGCLENEGEGDTDSPLSSPPSSIGNSPRPSPPARPNAAATVIEPSKEPTIDGNRGIAVELTGLSTRRSFRPRAPIQVHPYALEDARYRQTLKSRGLRPVPLQQTTSQPHGASEEDSQGADTFESSQSKNSDSQSRPPSPAFDKHDEEESQSPIRGVRIHNTAREISFGDDLPDLSDILKCPVHQILKKASQKGRPSRKSRRAATDDESRIYDLPDDEAVPLRVSGKKSLSFRIPPSPPRSNGTLSSQDGLLPDTDEYSIGNTTPALLPTPLLSSDKHGMKRLYVETLSSSDTEQVVISDDSSTHSSAIENSEDESQGIQKLRRRMKGVLPASWLKLDVKQRDSNLVPRQQARSPVKPSLEKGIAQRVVSSSARQIHMENRSVHADAIMYTSVESDSDEPTISPLEDLDGDARMSFDGDVVEDDTIDAMLAPRTRKGSSRRRQQPRTNVRSKLFMTRRRRLEEQPSYKASTSAGTRSKHASLPNKRLKKRHHKPKMTVLDAPGFQDKEIPQFLKIAGRRRGVSRMNKHQDPSTKFFKLATAEDTLDVLQELDYFRNQQMATGRAGDSDIEGTIRRPSNSRPRHIDDKRDKIAETIGHNHSTQLTRLKQTTAATLQRIHTNQAGPRSMHLGHDSTPRDRPVSVLEHFKPRQLHRSRPGSDQQPEIHTSKAGQTQENLDILYGTPSLVRRLPRPPARRRGTPGKPSGNHPTMSTASDRYTRPRPPPRKGFPKALRRRSDNIADREDIPSPLMDELQHLCLHDTTDIISQAINNPPGGRALQNDNLFQGLTLLQRNVLQILSSPKRHSSTLFESARHSTVIETPQSRRTLSCASWTVDTSLIMHEVFVEIASVICNDASLANTGRIEHALLLNRCVNSLERIIIYIDQSLSFSGVHELRTFLASTFDDIDRLRQEIESCSSSRSQPYVAGTVVVLNRLLILAHRLAEMSKSAAIEGVNSLKVSEINQVLVSLSWSLALRQENTGRLFSWIAGQSGSHLLPDAPPYDSPVPEIETIFILHHLRPSQSWASDLSNLLSIQLGTEKVENRSAETLAYTVLILGCVYAFIASKERTAAATGPSDNFAYPGLSGLPTAMTDFLKFFTQEAARRKSKRTRDPYLVKLGQFGLVAFQWCLVLARSSEEDAADNLLKQMFKQYSDKSNNMLDFFSPTSTDVPRFLERQAGISDLVPEPGDTDFHLFLKLTAFTLAVQPSIGSEDSEKLRKLKLRKLSLVFSLLPNNGRDVGDDKPLLVEESKPLTVKDLGAVANRYLLFSTLYHYAPIGVKPEIAKVRDLVEFSNAHDAVCTLALRCWASTVRSTIPQSAYGSLLHELAVWIQDMIFKISDKLRAIPVPNDHDFDSNDEESYAALAHRQNRETANSRLISIAKTYAEAVELCFGECQARYLLTGDCLPELISLCNASKGLNDRVISGIFNVLSAYLKKASGGPTESIKMLRDDIRDILLSHFNRPRPPDDMLLMSMVETWYTLARILVDGGNNTWDDYWSIWASYSIYRFGGGNDAARHCRVIMSSKIASSRAFVISQIHEFLPHWLTGILAPEDDIKFEHLLTNTLMKTFPDLLGLGDLCRRIADGAPHFDLTRNDLIKHRLGIVRHVVRNIIHDAQSTNELSPVASLIKSHAVYLLEVITSALKDTWGRLEGAARHAWSQFIHEVVFELSRYSIPAFKIDPWFLDPEDLELEDKVLHLERLFVCDLGNSALLDEEYAVGTFRIACELAVVHDTTEDLIEHLATTFSASDVKYIDDEGRFMLDIPAQFRFVQAVFPVYIERVLDDHSPTALFGLPVLAVATEICTRLDTRVDLEDQAHMEKFAGMMVMLMSAAVKALQSTPCDFKAASGCRLGALAKLVWLCASVCSRWAHLYLQFPTSAAIHALQPHVQTFGLYVYEYACSALGLPCVPTDPTFWAAYPSSEVRSAKDFGFYLTDLEPSVAEDVAALNQVAKDDLEHSARELWTRAWLGPAGPVWRYRRAGAAEWTLEPDGPEAEEVKGDVKMAVAELVRALELLGVR